MPPDTPPTTVYRLEAAPCGPTGLFVTEFSPEDNACANEGNVTVQVLAAFTDGANMVDGDGNVVAWTDWPPEGFTP